ncbi:MAG TPA: metalloregulator ArsR/SmtB family transcription factor, partial [Actinomycetota bacterium]|nr:metalloregulator ArsR/SmtB family transcription factor [Actinomycetota bacterium]
MTGSGPVFEALGDPTRREVVRRLAEGGPASATRLAADLPVSRQAVAKHLAALEEAGLVTGERSGRERRFRLTPAPFSEAVA